MIVGLPRGAIMSIDLEQEQCVVQCREGSVWITKTGDAKDYFLDSGQESLFSGPGTTVIEALTGACVCVEADSNLTMRVTENDPCVADGGFSLQEIQERLKSLWTRGRLHEKAVTVHFEPTRF
jgi:hypothetical protein